MGGVVFTLCNLAKVGSIPLGNVAVWLHIFIFGVLKGTNSFICPYESMLVFFIGFLRTGLWEFTAYILMTSSTANIAMYQQESWKSGKLAKIRQWRDVKLSIAEKGIYLVGVLVLLTSAFFEFLAIFGIIP